MTATRHTFAPRGAVAPGRLKKSPSENQRAQGMPGAGCTRSLVCSVESTRVFTTGSARRPGIPYAMVLTAYLRALPGDRAFLSPSPGGYGFVRPGRARKTSAGLDAGVEASGPHDFAVRSCISRQHALDRSRAKARPAIPSRARRCRVHRIPFPTSVTIASRPSLGDGMARVLK
jgi:hypothetical protein